MRDPSRRPAALWLAPLVLFQLVVFVLPLGWLALNAVREPAVAHGLPTVAKMLGAATVFPPDPAAPAALGRDLAAAVARDDLSAILKPVRQQQPELWQMLRTLAALGEARLAALDTSALIAIDRRWAEPGPWQALALVAREWTDHHLLSALDLERTGDGTIRARPETAQVYRRALWTTLEISLSVTALTALLAYPVARVMVLCQPGTRSVVMALVLLPFWTSLLVRTYAWIAILQREGVVNSLLMGSGATEAPLSLAHNRLGLMIAMVHVLLPFMILPLYSVMRQIPPEILRAAESLGATRAWAFVTVYLPQTVPGLLAGSALVFSTALGYYITPLLIGGPREAMLSNLIALNINQFVNWGLAAALSILLVAVALGVFACGMMLSAGVTRRLRT